MDPKNFLTGLFSAAVDAASAEVCLPPHLPAAPKGRTVVIGAGKGAAAMAKAVEDAWPEDANGPLEGLVVTRYGHTAPCKKIEVVEAAHPVPDAECPAAARRILEMVSALGSDDLVLALISGGGSSLLALPADGLTLEDKQTVNKALLTSGATISEMNCVRKHLSAIKGGRLAAVCAPARVLTLAVSDVPGDDPSVIASGPTVPDVTTFADAQAIIDKYAIDLPPAVSAHLAAGADETPKPGAACFANTETRVIATSQASLEAAAKAAEAAGYSAHILSDKMEGEARDVALVHAALAEQVLDRDQPFTKPTIILSGGETTVTVRGKGRGGRNAEFLLALADALKGRPGIFALACDTDGIDGTEDNAGAYLGPDSLARAAKKGVHAPALLANNDGYAFFECLGDLIKTGPTLTNINDFRAILIDPSLTD